MEQSQPLQLQIVLDGVVVLVLGSSSDVAAHTCKHSNNMRQLFASYASAQPVVGAGANVPHSRAWLQEHAVPQTCMHSKMAAYEHGVYCMHAAAHGTGVCPSADINT